MASNQPSEINDAGVWQAELLRVTAFPSAGVPVDSVNWWEHLLGQPAENRISRPREDATEEQGPFEAGRLTLGVLPFRIDWLYNNPETEVIGQFPEALRVFRNFVLRWLETAPQLDRLAFGAVLNRPVASRIEGYHTIAPYLSRVQLDAERSSDFLYQINRPRESRLGVPRLNLNRLSKWSVAVRMLTQIGLVPVTAPQMVGTLRYACRLEMDINTVVGFGELPSASLPMIFQELLDLGLEIAVRGDIP